MTVLDMSNVRITYEQGDNDTDPAVDGVDLTIQPGERVGLVGESGSGKSTLARSIVGLHSPGTIQTGSITVDGMEVTNKPERWRAIRGQQVGFAFQNPTTAFDPVYPVGTQIREAIAGAESDSGIFGRSQRYEWRERAAELLDAVGIRDPDSCLDSYPSELSGGQCQRAMLATALAGEPALLVTDEPTAGLDVTTQKQVLEQLDQLADERSLGILMITHNLAVVAAYCDQIVVLADGAVVETGDPADVITAPKTPETAELVEAAKDLSIETGSDEHSSPTNTTTEPVVELDAVSKEYPVDDSVIDRLLGRETAHTAVENVSLSVQRGETVGIVGESGGGKSTIVDLIAGLERPTSGDVRIDGNSVGAVNSRSLELLGSVGVLFQQPHSSLDPRWSIRRSIAEPLRRQGWEPKRRSERVDELLGLVNLPESAGDSRPGQLSGGQVQRAALARAVAPNPSILLLDEPVSALDATTRSEVLSVLEQLQCEHGHSLLFVSHDLGAVSHVADRVGVLENGRLVELSETDEILENPQQTHTKQLVESVPELPVNPDETDYADQMTAASSTAREPSADLSSRQ